MWSQFSLNKNRHHTVVKYSVIHLKFVVDNSALSCAIRNSSGYVNAVRLALFMHTQCTVTVGAVIHVFLVLLEISFNVTKR